MRRIAVITVIAAIMLSCGGGSLDGTYALADSNAESAFLIITGNKMKVEQEGKVLDEITFKFVEQNKEKGINSGVISMTTKNGDIYEEKYEFDGNKLSLWGLIYEKQNVAIEKKESSNSLFGGGGGNSKIILKAETDVIHLSLAGEGDVTIDWGDGEHETDEIRDFSEKFSYIYSGKSAQTITITGKKITTLDCPSEGLTSLDVSKCSDLVSLYCNDNQLTSLDVRNCTALVSLECQNNQLTSLNLNKNTELTYLYCSFNQLKNLDVSKNTYLIDFYCGYNQLTSLDVSKNTSLLDLSIITNQLNGSALNLLFKTLRGGDSVFSKNIYIVDNPGTNDCDQSIATNKGWKVNSTRH